MKQLRTYITNTLQLTISFLTNFFVMTTFFGIIEILYPIRNKYLAMAMEYMHLPYTSQNIVILLSAICVLLPAILYRTKIVKNYVLWTLSCRKPDEEEKIYMERALNIVCQKNNENIKDYELYVSEMKEKNAYALGTNMILITKELLDSTDISERSIAGLMAHEIGHIRNRHTNVMLITSIMSMFGSTVSKIYTGFSYLFKALSAIPIVGYLMIPISWMFSLMVIIYTYFLHLPELLISSFSSRMNEYEADRYACEIGMSFWLYSGLRYITLDEKADTETNQLAIKIHKIFSSHPENKERIENLKRYAVEHEELPEL